MRIWWITALFGLVACAPQPVNYSSKNPADSIPESWQEQASVISTELDLMSLIPETDLSNWVDEALMNNPGLQLLTWELAESGWISHQEGANRLPSVSLNGSTTREHSGDSSQSPTTRYGLALTSRWEVDVWGRLADSQSAAELDESALAADLLYAQRSLAANLLKNWLSWSNQQQRLAVERQRHQTLTLNETVIRERYRSGLGRLQDLETARVDVKQSEADLASLAETSQSLEYQLQQSLGSFESVQMSLQPWPDVGFPELQLPAVALGQRPDLLAAFQRIQAADKRSKVAYKNLLPNFNLSLDITQNQLSSGDLLSTDPAWLLLGQLTQPLFQGGKLRAQLSAAEARAAQSYWRYREQLLAAMLEVEAGLNRERSLQQQHESMQQALLYAEKNQTQFERRYRQGLVSIQDLLSAQQQTFNIRARLLQILLNRATNRIDLGLTLGLPITHGV